MRSTHALAFFLVFLTACATAGRPHDRDPDPAPPPPAEIARTYRSALPICYDAALKVCRDRDYRVVSQQPSSSIAARGASFDLTFVFARTPENRTRVSIRRTPEHRDEATRLLDQLCDALLEPRP